MERCSNSASSSRLKLTARECDVLEWLVRGKSNWEIGQLLGISERTAKFHVQNILRKFGVTTRAQVVAMAIHHKVVEP